MPKKMHDILPPKTAHKVEETVKSLGASHKKTTRRKAPVMKKEGGPFPAKGIFASVLVAVLLVCLYGYIKLPKADIEIWPKTDTLSVDQKIVLDTTAKGPDTLNSIIPAKYVEVIKDGSQSFPATGIATNDGKATGTMTIYNKMDSAFTLITGTHFLSDSGKYFVTMAKVVVPASKTVNGKSTPGSINVQIQATDVGTDHNISPSKFSVPKLNGTTYYYSIYGQSDKAMAGGHTGKVKKVTSDDIIQAKELLTTKTLQDGKNELKSKLAVDDILIDRAEESSVINAVCDIAPDTIKDSFTETVKVKVSALVFKKQDIEALVKNTILAQLSKDKDFLASSLNTNYTTASVLDTKKGTLTLDVKSSVKTYQSVDNGEFVDLLSGKSSDQVQSTISQIYDGEVAKIQVNFWPFWVTKVPGDGSRVKIHTNF